MELKYAKKLAEAGITEGELSAKAKTGIKGIKDVMRGISLQEGKGKSASATALEKLSFNDEIVCDEIDKLIASKAEGKKAAEATAAAAAEAERLKAEKAAKETAATEEAARLKAEGEKKTNATAGDAKPDPKGLLIEAELKKLLDGGKEKLTLAELKSAAPAAYSAVFDSYKSGEENGVATSHYSLLETEVKEVFTISKN